MSHCLKYKNERNRILKKKKEDIRNQILKKVKDYRNKKGIIFYDDTKKQLRHNIALDDNELEILLIKLKRSKHILLTTKSIYFLDKESIKKIDGQEINRFDYMEFVNGEKIIEGSSSLKIFLLRFKMRYRIGHYRIIKNDGRYIEVSIWKTRFADCLNASIKKLKFVANKYEAI